MSKELNDLRIAKNWKGVEEYVNRELVNEPQSSTLLFCLSECLGAQNRFEEAIAVASKAVAFDPLSYQSWGFLANSYAGVGNWAAVESAAKRTIELAPDLPHAHWLLGHCSMVKGDWKDAWSRTEYGLLCDRRKIRSVPSKAWQGQDVKGKTLFVWSEQGAGDAIQYARFLPLLKKKTGATIIFECRSNVVNLLAPLTQMTVAEQPDRTMTFGFDYHLSVMDIPRLLGLDTKDIIGAPYLDSEARPDAEGKIGLVWKGFSGHANDYNRSIPDEMLEEFKGIKDLVAVQPDAECPEWLPNRPVSDFHSTAQVLKGLKCLVTVDTSTAHIAGALGVPTIMIAPIRNTEPRWAAGDATPWYDSWKIVHGQTFEESIKKAKELLNGY